MDGRFLRGKNESVVPVGGKGEHREDKNIGSSRTQQGSELSLAKPRRLCLVPELSGSQKLRTQLPLLLLLLLPLLIPRGDLSTRLEGENRKGHSGPRGQKETGEEGRVYLSLKVYGWKCLCCI